MKKSNILVTAGIICTFVGASQLSADASVPVDPTTPTLDFSQDLRGRDAVIKTENGKNVLYTKKGKWELNENSKIYSSKNLTIYLDNTSPVTIDSIWTRCNLEFRGKGSLIANTQDEFGINVGGDLRSFKYAKRGAGKITATGTTAGVHVNKEIQSNGGTLEGNGKKYGIFTKDDIKPYYGAVIKGIATDDRGYGVWAHRDVYAWKGAKVYGKGNASGVYSQTAKIEAEDYGTITGISTNLNSDYSAIHSNRRKLEADDGGRLIEEYEVAPEILEANSFKPTDYTAIRRNMLNFQTYRWTDNNKKLYTNHHKGIDFTNVTADSVVQGVRVHDYKHEPVELDDCGLHIVRFGVTNKVGVIPTSITE